MSQIKLFSNVKILSILSASFLMLMALPVKMEGHSTNIGQSASAQTACDTQIRSVTFTGKTSGSQTGKPNINTNLRSNTTTSASVLATIPPNTQLTFSGWAYGQGVNDVWTDRTDFRWFRVTYQGKTGWVASAVIYGNPPNSSLTPTCSTGSAQRYTYRQQDYLRALYRDSTANGMSRTVHDGTSAFDSDDSAPDGLDRDNRVYALVGGEVIEAKNGKIDPRKSWSNNGTFIIYNRQLNKTFIYWHFAEGSINPRLKGQTIAAGSLIGVEGTTGNSSANHTHVEVHNGRVTWIPANSGRLDVAQVFQDAVRQGLVNFPQ